MPERELQRHVHHLGGGTAIHREAGRSPRREAAPVAVRAANYVDVITKIAPQLRGFIYGRCGRYVDSGLYKSIYISRLGDFL